MRCAANNTREVRSIDKNSRLLSKSLVGGGTSIYRRATQRSLRLPIEGLNKRDTY